MSKTKVSLLCSACIALAATLNGLFVSMGLYCHFYIAALICVMLCPFEYAMLCAAAAPIISVLVTGVPNASILPAVLAECIAFTFACAAFRRYGEMNFKSSCFMVVSSVALGRVTGILVNSLLYLPGKDAVALWSAAALLRAIPETLVVIAVALPLINIKTSKNK